MNRLTIWILLYLYYAVWLILPIFDLEGKYIIFPLPSRYAVFLPIWLLLIGFASVGTYLGVLTIRASTEVSESEK
ncbi:uncharacterized protein KNAG_0F02760 [Huiozyma naganishii CBS 8797]|uniref:Dolichol phosphate-mannose biosynthesis regulatory protein n=1 Tax=Huiozyma naganishii (strain ATCC MYA-139 / BCRC 22969 / CBS 8797 / KCTC 17520 / NBRC 10181 / NCYC 3082 / Yp74L-3) TaxID=1071383 RepID=J7RN03_HUIN7|nr:hypothetical protein KNAG_0F02760 [Kazachstania naganishii CBS 8797]CCK70938.1 hypothetical protein KNAG_0F02760 [Kazachstania naganishii CBS 8797]